MCPTLRKRARLWLTLGLFLVASLFVYRAGIHGDFILDDNLRIVNARASGDEILFEPLPPFSQGLFAVLAHVLPDRPFLMATIWANYAIGGGDPFTYKLVNILLHGLAAFSLYLLLLRVSEAYGGPAPPSLALALSLVFLAHPINSQAVTMAIQRGVILSSLFTFLMMGAGLGYLKHPERRHLLVGFLTFLIAVLSKPNVIFAPVLLLLVAWPLGKMGRALRFVLPLLPLTILPALFYFLFRDNYHETTFEPHAWVNYGLVQARVVFHYFGQLLYPVDINTTYTIPTRASLFSGLTWLFLLGHAVMIGLALWGFRRKVPAAMAALCAYVALVPESSIFPIPHVVFDHRMYLPFAMICLSVFLGARHLETTWRRALVGALFLFGVWLATLTHARVEEVSYFPRWLRVTAMKHKADHRANLSYASLLFVMRHYSEARDALEELVRTYPDAFEYRELARAAAHPRPLDALAELLADDAGLMLSDTTLSTILLLVYERRDVAPDLSRAGGPAARMRHSYRLFREYARLLPEKPSYLPVAKLYFRNLTALSQLYAELAPSGLLWEEQQDWLQVQDSIAGWEESLGQKPSPPPKDMPLLLQRELAYGRGERIWRRKMEEDKRRARLRADPRWEQRLIY